MLARYFGFEEDPFGVTPDPRYLYSSGTHREALASLHYSFQSNRGFTALIAPPGMGKTTLLFEFLQRIRDTARTSFLFNSQCDSTDLVRNILTEIGLTPQDSMGGMLQQINSELVATARTGRRFVVVVDEAQNLSEPALETLRLLTNFETSRAKLMQIVLSGQPQLGVTLNRSELVQMRQRISIFCRLEPFGRDEVAAYIGHRLAVAGYKGPTLFSDDALACIAEASEGIPRNINSICFNALSLSCALKKNRVDLAVLDEVVQDLQLVTAPPAEQKKESTSVEIRTKRSDAAGQDSPPSRLRVPGLAALLLLAACAAFWAADVFSARRAPAGQTVLPHDAATEVRAPAAPANNKESKPDAIEIIVDPKQTLSGISVRTLGTFDDEVLRQIKQLNPSLENPDQIVPGERLLLPRRLREPDARKDHEQKF